jgi:hypothetical protein
MNDSGSVRLGNGFARLLNEARRQLDGHRALLEKNLPEVLPVEELHDHVRSARIELADVEHLGRVFALQLCGRPGLANETLDRFGIAEGLVANELDGHELIELLVSRRDDDAHASDAKDTLDAVLAGKKLALAHSNPRLRHDFWR